MPVFGTIASQFNDPGTNSLYKALVNKVVEKTGDSLDSSFEISKEMSEKIFVIPSKKIGSFFWKKGDVGIIDRFGPDGISKLVKIISNKTGRLQTGFIYDYAFVMLLGLSILLTYLILK